MLHIDLNDENEKKYRQLSQQTGLSASFLANYVLSAVYSEITGENFTIKYNHKAIIKIKAAFNFKDNLNQNPLC